MFKETDINKQTNAFSTPALYMSKSAQKFYEDEQAWHNLFRNNVVNKIVETIFSVLYDKKNGAPNASICVLVGMMILKEGQGWSDEQLFENCRYNLLIRSALGLFNLDDAVPAPSTYYLFRHNLVEYEKTHGEDLLKLCQAQITHNQIVEYSVNGKKIRMDSKLLGSNIKWYSRYELIHETVRLFFRNNIEAQRINLTEEENELIQSILGETGDKAVYRRTKDEIDTGLVGLGRLMYHIIKQLGESDIKEYQTLKTVFSQQYEINEDGTVQPKDGKSIDAGSIQSPHDTDCTYRNKDGNQVKGYSVNVTETCSEAETEDLPVLNLITSVDVNKNTKADNDFLQEAIQKSSEILTEKIESINADGAYHSPENQDYCEDKDINLLLSAIQGVEPEYDLQLDEAGDLQVTDIKRKTTIKAQPVKRRKGTGEKKWRIKTEKGKYRYFNNQNIATSALRRKLKGIPIEELNRRNNVEATIFQMGYHYPNDKSRYRTLARHKLWAYSRALWINHVRIVKYTVKTVQKPYFSFKNIISMVQYGFDKLIFSAFLLKNKLKLYPQKNPLQIHL